MKARKGLLFLAFISSLAFLAFLAFLRPLPALRGAGRILVVVAVDYLRCRRAPTLLVGLVRRDRRGEPDGPLDAPLAEPRDLAVGMLFLPERDRAARAECRAIVERAVRRHGPALFGWREVPVELTALGEKAIDTRPHIVQVLLGRPDGRDDDE